MKRIMFLFLIFATTLQAQLYKSYLLEDKQRTIYQTNFDAWNYVDLLDGWNFTSSWSATGTATINDLNTFTTVGSGGIYKNSVTTATDIYKITKTASTTALSLHLRSIAPGTTLATFGTSPTDSTAIFEAVDAYVYLYNDGAGATMTFEIKWLEIWYPLKDFEGTLISVTYDANKGAYTILPSYFLGIAKIRAVTNIVQTSAITFWYNARTY